MAGKILVFVGLNVRKPFDSLVHAVELLHTAKRGLSPSYKMGGGELSEKCILVFRFG